MLEAVAFGAGSWFVLTVIGLAITEFTVPAGGLQLLLAPAIGLAVLALGFQWLTFVVPAYVAAIVVIAAAIPFAVWTAWRRGPLLWEGRRDLVGSAVVTLALFLALLQIDVQRGFFTLGGYPSDNVFIYVQAAQYLVDHPAPSLLHAAAYANPGTDYLLRTGHAFPNSVGPIDAAISVLTFRPVYAVFDSVNAVALAVTIGPVWVFVRRALAASWWAAAAAAGVLATNQLVYWVAGLGFQQESLAMPIFATGLVVAALVAREPTVRGGALLGILTAALAGLYLPIAVLLAICAVACVAVAAMLGRGKVMPHLLRPVAGAAVAGVLAGLPVAYVLFFRGGLAIWAEDSGVRVPAGGVSMFPFLPYVLGAVPFAHGWEAGRLPFGTLDRIAFPLYGLGSALILLLLLLGVVRAVLRERTVEASLVIAAMLFAAYEAGIAQYPYGFVKAIGYMVPLTSAFIAFGGMGVETLARGVWVRRARIAGPAAVAIVLAASALASRDMVRLWLENPGLPTFPDRYVALSALADHVPEGSTVLIDYPANDYGSLVKDAAVAYWLPDRNVRVYAGDMRLGTFPDQDVRPAACAFEYVISTAAPGAGFTAVATDAEEFLTVYRRDGPSCA